MKFKKIIAGMLVGAMALSLLCGCSKQPTTDEDKKVEKKEEKKTLKVGMEVAYPPFEYYEEDGTTVTGIDYDLAVAIGEKLGYEIEIVETEWDNIFTGLDEGKYDVIMSAITITDERKAKYDFSNPYIQNYQALVTLSNAKIKPVNMNQIVGLQVGCLKESISSEFLKNHITTNNIKAVQKDYDVMLQAFSDLKDGRIGAVICDSTLADQYCKDPTYQMTWKQQQVSEEFGICFPKGSKLVADFNNALDELEKEGKLNSILEMYMK